MLCFNNVTPNIFFANVNIGDLIWNEMYEMYEMFRSWHTRVTVACTYTSRVYGMGNSSPCKLPLIIPTTNICLFFVFGINVHTTNLTLCTTSTNVKGYRELSI